MKSAKRFNSGREWKEGKIAEEETQTVVLHRWRLYSYRVTVPSSVGGAHSPDIADNEEELSDSHSFDEQIHAMNENIGGNVADNTSEVEMVEKLQNQETYLTIRPEHQDEHHKSRETIAFLKEKQDIQEKVWARSRPRIQEDQCRQRCDAG